MSASSDPETTLFVFLVPQGEWKSVCRIPLSALRELSKRPAKWILFLASIIYGAPGQLHVSGNPMSPEIPKNAGADTETDPAAPPIPLECYFVSRYCPRYVDLRILADRTSARTESNPRNNRFGKRLRNRDRTCVFIQASPFIQCRATRAADCDAAHIIPHSKGREYVQIFEEIHNIPDEERLHGIDDPRNGLLLYKPLHLASGQGECTFLLVSDSSSNYTRLDEQVQVPNRYMGGPSTNNIRTAFPNATTVTKRSFHWTTTMTTTTRGMNTKAATTSLPSLRPRQRLFPSVV
ncbi:hypothetical protein B0H11DRAFT_1978289 [Mycena galericulata]|nr:hypothetical protein B0H11DRAFT_1978289 [Mycena galericulata]